MDTTEPSDDRFTRPVNDSDHLDLVNAASRRSPRVRTMLWATLSPDGMDRAAFGQRTYVHEAALKAQAAALREGFIPVYEGEGTIDQQRMRITQRWQEEYRPGFAALTDWVHSSRGSIQLLRSISAPELMATSARLLRHLSVEPTRVELLPEPPRPDTPVEPWLTIATEALELLEMGPAR